MKSTLPEVVQNSLPALTKIASIVHPTRANVESLVLSELSFLEQRLALSEGLRKCTPESLVMAVRQAIRDNMSLNQSSNLVYLLPQNINTGTKDAPIWTTIASYALTPDGKISLARQTGGILDFEQPHIEKDGTGKVIGGSIRLLKPSFPQPRWELFCFDESNIERWKAYSEKKNKGVANPLYSSWKKGIDPEFMKAKIIKHSLSKLGTNINEIRGEAIPIVEHTPIVSPEITEASVIEEIQTESNNEFDNL